ncbi:MAG: VWA domain-containing protein, partial [Firmicutes bacterium]|nr:VWA domain-containing protein [Bacillota bacterium]
VTALLGIAFHECAHIIYLNFKKENEIIKDIENGKIYGDFDAETPEKEALADELRNAVQNPAYGKIMVRIYHTLSNIMSDVHDEGKMCRYFHGLVEKAITFSTESLRSGGQSVETMMKSLENGKLNKLSVMYSVILQFARFGSVIIEDDTDIHENEFINKLDNISHSIQDGCNTDDLTVKYSAINNCVLTLWPFIKELVNESENQNSQNGNDENSGNSSQNQSEEENSNSSQSQSEGNNTNSSQGAGQDSADPSEETVNNVLQSLSEGVKQGIGEESTSPRNIEHNTKAAQRYDETGKNQSSPMSDDDANNIINNAVNQMTKQLATQKAENEVENKAMSEENAVIQTVNMTSSHKGKKTHIIRDLDVSESDKKKYDKYMRELGSVSKTLQRQMMNALRDLKDGSVAKHKLYGRRIEATDSYRLDGRCFSNKKLPQDLPDMAISVLIDQSGSMMGPRIEASRKAAILLHDFAAGLNIPISIAGHCTSFDGISYFPYVGFERINRNDKYRLMHIDWKNACNRDGMAVNIAADLLQKRPEAIKLLIIISDGQPNDSNYGGEQAKKDIQEIVRRYKKKGIETFAAAIGDDKDRIKEIYREGFLDIDDISKLPKTLVKLVKKRIIA